jgi:hypothetical protein
MFNIPRTNLDSISVGKEYVYGQKGTWSGRCKIPCRDGAWDGITENIKAIAA